MGAKHGKFILAAGLLATLIGCDKSADSFSLLPDQANFQQVTTYVPKKIDILWVIDNSGSMETSQSNLATNFNSFIHRFSQYNYDFHMAVVTTDGWHAMFPSTFRNSTTQRFRDGIGSNHSGVFVMDRNTPNLSSVFTTDIKQGTNGDGDERAFESFHQSLIDSTNIAAGFRRDDAFLAVIVVSDEDDFSWNGTSLNESYTNPKLYSVASYTSFLDTYTKRAANSLPNYSVSAIGVLDQACKDQLSTDGFDRKIGQRYMQMVDATGGVKGSLCGDFGNTLELISDNIIELSSSFQLSREPVVSSIRVIVDGATIPNDATNGWTYDAATLTLTFHGSGVPGANSNIQIYFDPVTIKE
jgi:hypothetical protein